MSKTMALWVWCCWSAYARSKLSIPNHMWYILMSMPVSDCNFSGFCLNSFSFWRFWATVQDQSDSKRKFSIQKVLHTYEKLTVNQLSYMPTKIFKNRRKITFQGCRQVSSNPKVCSYPKGCIIKTTNCIESSYYPRSFAKCQPIQCK